MAELNFKPNASQIKLSQLDNKLYVGNIGTFEWNAITGAMSWSDDMYLIHGRERQIEPPTWKHLSQWIHPDDAERFWYKVSEVKLAPGKTIFIHRMVTPAGNVRFINSQFESFADHGGKVVRITGIVQDITAMVHGEQDLYRIQDMLHRIVNGPNSRMIVFSAKYNENGQVVDFIFELISGEIQRFHGGKDYTGKCLSKVFPETFASQFDGMVRTMVTGEINYWENYVYTDEFNRWYRAVDIKYKEGIIRFWDDITALKLSERFADSKIK